MEASCLEPLCPQTLPSASLPLCAFNLYPLQQDVALSTEALSPSSELPDLEVILGTL